MSESTIAKLVMSQRDQELRAERRWGMVDLVALPLGAVLLVFVLSLAAVAGSVASILRLRMATEGIVPQDTTHRERPPA
jgi:hypothetical protein